MDTVSGTIDQALSQASFLLLKAPAAAIEQADEILNSSPGHSEALLLRTRALRALGDIDQAEAAATQLVSTSTVKAAALRELALLSVMRGDHQGASDYLESSLADRVNDAGSWSLYADVRGALGDREGSAEARRTSLLVAVRDHECLEPALALAEDRLPDAERALRLRLRDFPTEVATIRMMAELATRLDRFQDAEKLLRRALEIAPEFRGARELLARNLQRSNRPTEALAEVDMLLDREPDDPSLGMLKASLLVRIGDQEAARHVYEGILEKYPRQATGWMSLGHVLKTLGDQKAGIVAYRRAIEEQPTLGEVWWSLANLKTFRFEPDDIAAMEAALPVSDNDEDRLHLHFALGKACEDAKDYAAAFDHWAKGNAIRRRSLPYDADDTQDGVNGSTRFFTPAILGSARGNSAKDPIFILGMPRSGSTLVEQILSSHSQIEGTMELPDMMDIAARVTAKAKADGAGYPDLLGSMTDTELQALGAEYLERTSVHRKTDRPYFIDKMPNNWTHIGLIRMILPNAHIIDTRRHPIGCCLSMWKQHFARGQAFSYDLGDLARYYRDYVTLTEHFSSAMPGLIHQVIYERMVADSETEVRKLLDFLDLPFEASCLKFWQNDRAVRTASSEQVRQPIFSEAVEHWRHFEPWLGDLITELKPVLATYPRA